MHGIIMKLIIFILISVRLVCVCVRYYVEKTPMNKLSSIEKLTDSSFRFQIISHRKSDRKWRR